MKMIHLLARNREVVGLTFGLLAFASWSFQLAMLIQPGWLLLLIVFLCSVAGFTLGGLLALDGLEPSRAVRHAVWCAAVTGVVATCCFALMSRRFPGSQLLMRAWLGGVLSVLPGMFCGMFSAGVAALVMARPSSPDDKRIASLEAVPHAVTWSVRGLIALLALLATGVLIPNFETPQSRPPAISAAPPTPASPPTPAAPPETYAVPAAMERSHALQWRLAKTRHIAGVNPELMMLSQDGRWFAYVSENESTLHVLDLHAFDTGRRLPLSHRISRMSLNPSADKIFVSSDFDSAQLAIIDLGNSSTTVLPKPKKHAIPNGRVLWWKDKEVLIASENSQKILNLDSLELDDAANVPSWKGTHELIRAKLLRELPGGLSDTLRWQWETNTLIERTELPETEGTAKWPVTTGQRLSIKHPERDTRLTFPSILVEENDRYFSAHDGSKVIRIRKGQLDVFYFEIVPAPLLKWTISMPSTVAECPKAAEIEAALKMNKLRAIVYRPMTNPLNQQVVGPDRSQVKAVLTFESWSDSTASLYVSDLYTPISQGDIVADLCFWEDEPADLFAVKSPYRWWLQLPELQQGSDLVSTLPKRDDIASKATAIAKAEAVVRKEQEEALRKTSAAAEARAAAEQAAKMAAAPRPAPAPPAPVVTSPADQLTDFIRSHHKKAEKSDVEGLVNDYADTVDHFKDGIVDRNFIMQDELKYHATHAVQEEAILGEIRTAKLQNQAGFSATYLLRVSIEDITNDRISNSILEINLIIIETKSGFKITSHKSEKKQ